MNEHVVTEGRPRRRNILFVLAGILLLGLLLWRCTSGKKDDREGRARPSATVGTAKAAAADVPVTVTAIGTVQPVVAATVRTQLSGVLFSIEFREGQNVSKGQQLAQIDPRPFRLALAQAQGNLARDLAQLGVAQSQLAKFQTLLRQDSIARQEVDTQRALVGQLEGTVAADRAAVGTAQLNLDYTSIKAPVSGKVGLRQADIGNYLTPGDANGIVVITQTSPIDIAFAVPQEQLPAVQQRIRAEGGLAVTALDQSGRGRLADGRFLTFDNQIDSTTGTVRAKARFDNNNGALFPNQFVNVSVLTQTLKNAVTVPVSSVRHGAQGDFLFQVMPDKTAKLRVVKTGPSHEGKVVILSGVKLGDTVITEGADRLDDGAKVSLPGDRPEGGNRGGRPGGR